MIKITSSTKFHCHGLEIEGPHADQKNHPGPGVTHVDEIPPEAVSFIDHMRAHKVLNVEYVDGAPEADPIVDARKKAAATNVKNAEEALAAAHKAAKAQSEVDAKILADSVARSETALADAKAAAKKVKDAPKMFADAPDASPAKS